MYTRLSSNRTDTFLSPEFAVSDQIPLLGVTTSGADPVQGQSRKLEETKRVLKSLLTVWGNDFRVPVPVQLMFSHKNITNIKHVQSCKVRGAGIWVTSLYYIIL